MILSLEHRNISFVTQKKLSRYIDSEFSIEYEVTEDDASSSSGSVVVFAPYESEHYQILQYISKNKLFFRDTKQCVR